MNASSSKTIHVCKNDCLSINAMDSDCAWEVFTTLHASEELIITNVDSFSEHTSITTEVTTQEEEVEV